MQEQAQHGTDSLENFDSSSSSSEVHQIHEHLNRDLHQPFMQQKVEQKQISDAAREFNNFINEALEEEEEKLFQVEASTIENIGDDNRTQDGNGSYRSSLYSDDQAIRESVFKIKSIQHEEEQLLQNFVMMANNMDSNERGSVKRIKDFFEAFNYEVAIRAKDKRKLYDKILHKEDQLFKQIGLLEAKFKTLEKNYNSIKKFHEIRSLRQTGRYKNNPSNLQKMKVTDNTTSKTMGQKFMTEQTSKFNHAELILTEKSQGQSNPITCYQPSTKSNTTKSSDQIEFIDKDVQDQIIIDETSVYDWIVDIDLITNVAKGGWKVFLSKKFADSQNAFTANQTAIQDTKPVSLSKPQVSQAYGLNNLGMVPTVGGWDGATVAVVGLYDKGKTFVLNTLTQSNLPSGKKVNTMGISFKNVNVDSGTHLILVDTAGSYSPVKIQNELSIVEKEATEMFITDLVFEISDYFICVVNDFTSLDQRYLDRLSRNLQNSPSKTFREIIVIHNLKEVESPEILEHVWSTQVTHIYQNGSIQRTKVAAHNPINGQLQEKHVLWFKTQFTRHVCLANDDSYLGIAINPWVFSLLRYWLKAVFVPVNRPFSVVDSILSFSKVKLSQYFRTPLSLKIHDTDDLLIKTICTELEIVDNVRIPQVSIDSSGLIMVPDIARPDSFLPATDIIATDKYIIYMDVPGLTKDEIVVYRQNVITIIKGIRKKPYSEVKIEKLDRSERKYGEFAISFKIPEVYERKWSLYTVENGVLTIVYDKDRDDQIVKSKNKELGDSKN